MMTSWSLLFSEQCTFVYPKGLWPTNINNPLKPDRVRSVIPGVLRIQFNYTNTTAVKTTFSKSTGDIVHRRIKIMRSWDCLIFIMGIHIIWIPIIKIRQYMDHILVRWCLYVEMTLFGIVSWWNGPHAKLWLDMIIIFTCFTSHFWKWKSYIYIWLELKLPCNIGWKYKALNSLK